MKKIILMVMMTVMSATMAMAASSPVETTARKAAEVMLSQAVESGYGTAATKDKILESGIVEEVAKTLVDNNFNMAKAVDKAAEVSVREGWFKDKVSAKKALRNGIENARKNERFIEKVYKFRVI